MGDTDFAAVQRLAGLSRTEIGESEEDVKINFVVPLLEALGHARLRFEHRRRDILLREGLPRTASVVVETKRFAEPLDRHLEQVERLALEERCLLAVLANGAEVRVFAPLTPGAQGLAETLVVSVRREELAHPPTIMRLASLVGAKALASGEAVGRMAEEFEAQALARRRGELVDASARARREGLEAKLRELDGKLAELARERDAVEREMGGGERGETAEGRRQTAVGRGQTAVGRAGERGREPLLEEGASPPNPLITENSRMGAEWSDDELFRDVGTYQRRVLAAFAAAGRRRLTLKELTRLVGLSPQATWGCLAAFTIPAKSGRKEAFLEVDKGPARPVKERGAAVAIREKYWGTVVRLYSRASQ